jgi:hypothetical protein
VCPDSLCSCARRTSASGGPEVVRGTLYVDDFSLALDFGNELLGIPYKYRIG